MSFSSTVKEELEKAMGSARHCRMAELAAMVEFCGRIGTDASGRRTLMLGTDNDQVKRKYRALIRKIYNVSSSVGPDDDTCYLILEGLDIIDRSGVMRDINAPASSLLLKQSCCKRAFLRGAYMCIGSMSDPKSSYHLEFVCDTGDQAQQIVGLLSDFDIESKIIERKKHYVVYIKEGESIVDFLGICEAHVALMNMENDRILKEVSNSVNRRNNCDVANIRKTVNAATRQIEDIEFLRDNYGLDRLSDNLREMALLRLEYPDATLPELGQAFDPPLGKSGVNHRLRKLGELADKYRR